MSNKRLHTPKAQTAKRTAPKEAPVDPKETARLLREQVYRLEVEIAAAPRLMQEHRQKYSNTLPPPEPRRTSAPAEPNRLIQAQLQSRRRRQTLLLAEFVVGFILVIGVAGWTYRAWLMFMAAK